MASNSKAAKLIKNGVDDVVERTRSVVNNGLDSAKESLGDGVNLVDRRVRKTAAQVSGRAGRLLDNVYGRYTGARKSLLGRYSQAKKKITRLQKDGSKYVSNNPGKTLLTVAGVALLVGLVASPRRRAAESR
ncbi:MAG TPA: hypothetical protein VF173_17700 [Thermoanaerobaculia bacterium]|nr:hypothetical protein [Thermoanaerobaculia bacterium]